MKKKMNEIDITYGMSNHTGAIYQPYLWHNTPNDNDAISVLVHVICYPMPQQIHTKLVMVVPPDIRVT